MQGNRLCAGQGLLGAGADAGSGARRDGAPRGRRHGGVPADARHGRPGDAPRHDPRRRRRAQALPRMREGDSRVLPRGAVHLVRAGRRRHASGRVGAPARPRALRPLPGRRGGARENRQRRRRDPRHAGLRPRAHRAGRRRLARPPARHLARASPPARAPSRTSGTASPTKSTATTRSSFRRSSRTARA